MPDPSPSDFTALCRKISRFASLPPGWDDLDAKVIPPDSVSIACCFVALSFHNGYDLPHASVDTDGGIGLTWLRGRDRLAMTVEPDGVAVWASSVERRVEPGGILDFSKGKDPPLDAARDLIASWYTQTKAA